MATQAGRRPGGWSKSFWKKCRYPDVKEPSNSKEIITKLVENNFQFIVIGGCCEYFYKLKNEIRDYDFLINTEIENLSLGYEILKNFFYINSKMFFSNVVNVTILKNNDSKIDLLKKVTVNTHRKKGESFFGIKNFNYSTLIKNSEEHRLFGLPVKVMSKKDYLDSQKNKVLEK
jgi:hypothetical protein